MTVETDIARKQFATNGTTGPWTVPFYFLADTELDVTYTDAAGVDHALVLNVDFTVVGSGDEAGGTVTTVQAYAAGGQLVILRDVEFLQETEYDEGDGFPAKSHERGLDRLTMIAQQLREIFSRSITFPPSFSGSAIIGDLSTRKGKFIAFDAVTGALTYIAAAFDSSLALATSLAGSAGSTIVGYLSYGANAILRTGKQKLDDVAINVDDYGAVGDCVQNEFVAIITPGHDNSSAVQDAIEAGYATGGRFTVLGTKGKDYRLTVAPTLRPGCTLTAISLVLDLSGANSTGVRMHRRSRLTRTKVRTYSSGAPGSQAGIHGCVLAGDLVGNNGTIAAPSEFEGISHFDITHNDLWTSRGAAAIQINGGAHHFSVRRNKLPDTTAAVIGIACDWNFLGTLSTSSDAGIVAGKAAFLASTMYTTHPHDGTIANNELGVLSAAGSIGIRTSGVYNMAVNDNTVAGSVTESFYSTAGDPGFEFAPAAVKLHRFKGNKWRRNVALAPGNGFGFYSDAYADNIAKAVTDVGYVPLLPPIGDTDVLYEQCRTYAVGGGSVVEGFRINYQNGGRAVDCGAVGHKNGLVCDAGVTGFEVSGGFWTGNVLHGVLLDHPSVPPVGCKVTGITAYGNGGAGIHTGTAKAPVIWSNKLGRVGEATQANAISCDTGTTDADIQHNHNFGSTGTGWLIGSSTSYLVLKIWQNNTTEAGVATPYGGVNIVPFAVVGGVRHYYAMRAPLSSDTTPPLGFPGMAGDVIFITDPVADGAHYGQSRCTVTYTPGVNAGTWKGQALVSA